MELRFHEDAVAEWQELPATERVACRTALRYLEQLGDRLGAPFTSAVKGSRLKLRELRPRGGKCAWRVLYRREGEAMVILAVVPDAKIHRSAFNAGVTRAEVRLMDWPRGESTDEPAIPES